MSFLLIFPPHPYTLGALVILLILSMEVVGKGVGGSYGFMFRVPSAELCALAQACTCGQEEVPSLCYKGIVAKPCAEAAACMQPRTCLVLLCAVESCGVIGGPGV